ncbi:hypothetical protein [Streptomyces sp. NRRL B-24085]|uniref:effector-associated constant component EACC1 n=1 Tax=Streptomyces sp. NRRL B-24085 TaxID=1709476 RepID=UPI00117D1A95|nr:hypothetical protein [Streptomyces sp. NRRL B-24085]
MILRVGMAGPGAADELRSFRAWLLETSEIRQHCEISWVMKPPAPNEMGGDTLDLLQLITDNFWQVSTFALAFSTWRRTRHTAPTVTLEHNGTVFTVEGSDEQAVQQIIRALTAEQDRRDSA